MDTHTWLKILGAIAALIAGGFTLKFIFKSKQDNSKTNVTQKDIKVGGDNAGRDINKK